MAFSYERGTPVPADGLSCAGTHSPGTFFLRSCTFIYNSLNEHGLPRERLGPSASLGFTTTPRNMKTATRKGGATFPPAQWDGGERCTRLSARVPCESAPQPRALLLLTGRATERFRRPSQDVSCGRRGCVQLLGRSRPPGGPVARSARPSRNTSFGGTSRARRALACWRLPSDACLRCPPGACHSSGGSLPLEGAGEE